MKKTICIVLSALLISVFFVIGALADYREVSAVTYKSSSTSVTTDLDAIKAMPIVEFPTENDTTFYYTLYKLPVYEELSEVKFYFDPNINFGSKTVYFTDDQSGSNCVSLGVPTKTTVDGVDIYTKDLSGITGTVDYIVFAWAPSSLYHPLNDISVSVDMEVTNVWDGIGDFISGMFGAIGAIITGIIGSENNIILLFVIAIPLAAIAIGYLFKFIGKKRKKR